MRIISVHLINTRDMKTFTFIIFTFFLLSFAGEGSADEMISVRLRNYIGDVEKISFSITGDYLTLDPALKLEKGVKYTLSLKGGKMYLDNGKAKTKMNTPFVLYPYAYDEKHLIHIDERPYMGSIEFQIEKGSNIRPVNQLLLEDYLKGVVPYEVFPDWNLEALKAQTLAARTYAITHQTSKLDDTIQYQVYGGYNQFEKTIRAVNETKGEIITFNNKPINAFYSASNGGMTESNEHVWGGKESPYFPIKKDVHDPIQPWDFTLNKTQIQLADINWDDSNWWDTLKEKDPQITATIKNWLNHNGYPGEIKLLSIPHFSIDETKNESNRSMKGSIQIELMRRLVDGTIVFDKVSLDQVELKRIRPMIGGGHFRSYLLTSFEATPTSYIVKGNGNGHGVGMSQWGANIMAERGKTYKDILNYYYPGTKIKVVKSE